MRQKHCFLLILLAIFLIISVILNDYLFRQGRWYYFQLSQTRLDPLGLGYFPTNEQQEISGNTRVVFFGDSRAASWENIEIKGYEFINRGIGSQTSAQVLMRYDEHVKPLQPDIVIIQVGINDLKTIPIFQDREREIINELEANLLQIAEKCIAQDARVIMTTIFPISEVPIERRLFWS